MSSHQPVDAQDERRVLKFRPRTSDVLRADDDIAPADTEQDDDFKTRMWTNAAAFAFTIVLAAFGIWLAVRMSDVRSAQDCVLTGRRDCARLATPPPPATAAEPAIQRH